MLGSELLPRKIGH